jgi:hypothetical protein
VTASQFPLHATWHSLAVTAQSAQSAIGHEGERGSYVGWGLRGLGAAAP